MPDKSGNPFPSEMHSRRVCIYLEPEIKEEAMIEASLSVPRENFSSFTRQAIVEKIQRNKKKRGK